MTAQEIFDRVSTHLLTQGKLSLWSGACAYRGEGKPSLWSGACAYRGEGGTSCAVGCLIPDDAYDSSIEGATVSYLISNPAEFAASTKTWLDPLKEHKDLLVSLQRIHDKGDPRIWSALLETLAHQHNLEFKHAQN